MFKYQEEPSLLEVREWKEKCYQEDRLLTNEEYLKKLEDLVTRLCAEYHIELPKVPLPI